jgi:hypothetical protein
VIYRPTGACNTGQNHPTQPDMGGVATRWLAMSTSRSIERVM